MTEEIVKFRGMSKDRIDIMLDIETLNTDIGTVPIQVCMVPFDVRTGTVEHYSIFDKYLAIESIQDDVDIDMDTLAFWIGKNAKTFNKIISKCKSDGLRTVELLHEIADYLKSINNQFDNVYIWGKTKEFDIGILNYNFQSMNIKNPMYFRNTMELRTIEYALSFKLGITIEQVQEKFRPEKKSGNHNAFIDCIEQIKYLCTMLKEL